MLPPLGSEGPLWWGFTPCGEAPAHTWGHTWERIIAFLGSTLLLRYVDEEEEGEGTASRRGWGSRARRPTGRRPDQALGLPSGS